MSFGDLTGNREVARAARQRNNIGRGNMNRGRLSILGIVIAMMLVIASCSDSDSDDTTTTTSGETPTSQADVAAGEPYVLGCLTDLSGPTASTYGTSAEGLDLYVKALNDRGGIDGHPVELLMEDGVLDAAATAGLAVKLITEDDVTAIVCGSLSGIQPIIHAEAAEAKIPFIAGVSANPDLAFSGAPYYYSIGDEFTILGEVGGTFAKEIADVGKATCTAFESAGGRAFCDGAMAAAAVDGWETDAVFIPPTTTEYDPIAQLLVDTSPDVVISAASGEQLPLIWPALRRAGFEGAMLQGATSIRPEETVPIAVAEASGAPGDYYVYGRYRSSADPKSADLLAAVDSYGSTHAPSMNHVNGWALGAIMEEALSQCGFPCDGSALDGILNTLSFDAYGPEGLAYGPITFTSDNHYGPTFQVIMQFDGDTGEFTEVTRLEKPALPEFPAS